MNSRMLRSIGGLSALIALGLLVVWLLELLGVVELLDDPVVGAIAFAALAAFCLVLARKGEPPRRG